MDKSNDFGDLFSFESRENLPSPVKKFIKYLKGEGSFFFDVYEFENIIEYFIAYAEYKYALKALETAQYFYPEEKEFLFLKAQLLFREGESKKALELLKSIEPFFLDDPEFYFLVANIFLAQDKSDKALKFYNKLLKLVERKELTQYLNRIAESLTIVKKYKEALDFLHKIPESQRTNKILYSIANNFQNLGKTEEAEKYLLKIVKNAPTSAYWWSVLGEFYDDAGKINKAIDAYLNYFALAPNPEDLNDNDEFFPEDIELLIENELKIVDLLYQKKNYQKAFIFLEHISKHNNQKPYYLYMTECLLHLNRTDDAEKFLITAIEKGENSSDINFAMAKVAYQKKEYKTAIKYLDKAIDEENKIKNNDYKIAELYNFKGKTLGKLHIFLEAIDNYAKAVVLSRLKKEYLKDYTEYMMNSSKNLGNLLIHIGFYKGDDEQKVAADFITDHLKPYFLTENKKFNEKKVKTLIYNIIKRINKNN
jgi:tetratricopeptide (TPR) repeat protein